MSLRKQWETRMEALATRRSAAGTVGTPLTLPFRDPKTKPDEDRHRELGFLDIYCNK